MRFQDPSRKRGEERTGSLYGEPERENQRVHDEQRLYGEPCHEVRSDRDEQALYGEPQHETPEESSDLPDLELLFARLRAEPATGPTVFADRSGTSQLKSTEQ
jgi:hypothetical protein